MGPTRTSRSRVLLGALLLAAACASAPKRNESAAPRMQDSAPEKVASQRAAAAHELQLEQDDQRWGIEAARERKRQQDEAKARREPSGGAKGVDVTPPASR